jgi:hypothetical protein
MRTFKILVLALAIVAAGAAHAGAQTCFGNVPISAASPWSAGPVIDLSSGARTFTGVVTGGNDLLLGSVGIGRTWFSDDGGSSTNFSVTGAVQLGVGSESRYKVCPLVAFSKSSGPDDDLLDVELSGTQIGAGAAVGFVAMTSGTREIVPSISLVFSSFNSTAEFQGVEDSFRSNYTNLGLGVGFIFNQRTSVQPAVFIPLGLDDADPTFELIVAFAFGGS